LKPPDIVNLLKGIIVISIRVISIIVISIRAIDFTHPVNPAYCLVFLVAVEQVSFSSVNNSTFTDHIGY